MVQNLKKQFNVIIKWLFSTNQKDIFFFYLIFGAASVMIGTVLSVVIRSELAMPGSYLFHHNYQLYNILVTVHAFVMAFLLVSFLLILVCSFLNSERSKLWFIQFTIWWYILPFTESRLMAQFKHKVLVHQDIVPPYNDGVRDSEYLWIFYSWISSIFLISLIPLLDRNLIIIIFIIDCWVFGSKYSTVNFFNFIRDDWINFSKSYWVKYTLFFIIFFVQGNFVNLYCYYFYWMFLMYSIFATWAAEIYNWHQLFIIHHWAVAGMVGADWIPEQPVDQILNMYQYHPPLSTTFTPDQLVVFTSYSNYYHHCVVTPGVVVQSNYIPLSLIDQINIHCSPASFDVSTKGFKFPPDWCLGSFQFYNSMLLNNNSLINEIPLVLRVPLVLQDNVYYQNVDGVIGLLIKNHGYSPEFTFKLKNIGFFRQLTVNGILENHNYLLEILPSTVEVDGRVFLKEIGNELIGRQPTEATKMVQVELFKGYDLIRPGMRAVAADITANAPPGYYDELSRVILKRKFGYDMIYKWYE